MFVKIVTKNSTNLKNAKNFMNIGVKPAVIIISDARIVSQMITTYTKTKTKIKKQAVSNITA